uniref:Uncharacterized protein n=1 Tax=Anopheles braziliensis TaxID=58242 RepID=A0A2M3ZLT0_9DIPT
MAFSVTSVAAVCCLVAILRILAVAVKRSLIPTSDSAEVQILRISIAERCTRVPSTQCNGWCYNCPI